MVILKAKFSSDISNLVDSGFLFNIADNHEASILQKELKLSPSVFSLYGQIILIGFTYLFSSCVVFCMHFHCEVDPVFSASGPQILNLFLERLHAICIYFSLLGVLHS